MLVDPLTGVPAGLLTIVVVNLLSTPVHICISITHSVLRSLSSDCITRVMYYKLQTVDLLHGMYKK